MCYKFLQNSELLGSLSFRFYCSAFLIVLAVGISGRELFAIGTIVIVDPRQSATAKNQSAHNHSDSSGITDALEHHCDHCHDSNDTGSKNQYHVGDKTFFTHGHFPFINFSSLETDIKF